MTDLERVREYVEHLRKVITDLLEAPYIGGPAPAITKTNACIELGHPKRETGACYCGKMKP